MLRSRGKLRVEKHVRQRRDRDPRPRLSLNSGADRSLLQANGDNDLGQFSNNVFEDPPTATQQDSPYNHQQSDELRDTSSKAFRCIFCEKRLATKGNTRKHIEQQHVSKAFQKCSGCGNVSPNVPKAKNHSKVCPKVDRRCAITSFDETRDDRRVYGSEFSGQCFTNRRGYVDHLLDLSECLTSSALPTPSVELKLRALLRQPAIQVELVSVCQQWLGPTSDASELQWSEEAMENAIQLLEMGVVDVEPGPAEALRRNTVRPFLERLVLAGRSSHQQLLKPPSFDPTMFEQSINITESSGGADLFYMNTSVASYDQARYHAQAIDYLHDSSHSVQIDEGWSEGPFDIEPHSPNRGAADQSISSFCKAVADSGKQACNAAPANAAHGNNVNRQTDPDRYQRNWRGDELRVTDHPIAHSSNFEYSGPSFMKPPGAYRVPDIARNASTSIHVPHQPYSTPSERAFQTLQQPEQWTHYMQ